MRSRLVASPPLCTLPPPSHHPRTLMPAAPHTQLPTALPSASQQLSATRHPPRGAPPGGALAHAAQHQLMSSASATSATPAAPAALAAATVPVPAHAAYAPQPAGTSIAAHSTPAYGAPVEVAYESVAHVQPPGSFHGSVRLGAPPPLPPSHSAPPSTFETARADHSSGPLPSLDAGDPRTLAYGTDKGRWLAEHMRAQAAAGASSNPYRQQRPY